MPATKLKPFKVARTKTEDPYLLCRGQRTGSRGQPLEGAAGRFIVMAYPPRQVAIQIQKFDLSVGKTKELSQVWLPWLAVLSFTHEEHDRSAFIRCSTDPITGPAAQVSTFPFPHVFFYGGERQSTPWAEDQICNVMAGLRMPGSLTTKDLLQDGVHRNLFIVNAYLSTNMHGFDRIGPHKKFFPAEFHKEVCYKADSYLEHWATLSRRKVMKLTFRNRMSTDAWIKRIMGPQIAVEYQ